MKIAFVTRSLTGGGAERVVSVLANAFSEEVEEVSVIAMIEDKVTYPISAKVKYYANNLEGQGKIKRVYQRYSFLRNTLKRVQADVVISFCTQINIYSILAMKGLKGRLIISERNDPNSDPVQTYVRKLRDIIYRQCEAAVFQTPDAQSYFKGIINGKTTVIMNPIKNDLPEMYEGKRDNRIVSVARLTDVKNHAMLIKAFSTISKDYPDYVLEIYGEGPDEDNLRSLIKRLDLEAKVELKGFCSNVHEKIVTAKCFVLASNYEGISNSMLEALGMGIPTICTDCPIGGARMAIKNNINGILTKVGDQKGLEEALLSVLGNDDLCNRLSIEAIKINDLLSPTNICKEWLDFAKSVIQK